MLFTTDMFHVGNCMQACFASEFMYIRHEPDKRQEDSNRCVMTDAYKMCQLWACSVNDYTQDIVI